MNLKQWALTWKQAGVELSELRRERLASTDTQASIEALSQASIWANNTAPLRGTSGLVQQQAIFAKLRRL